MGAILLKNQHRAQLTGAAAQYAQISEWTQVSMAARALPQTTTDQIFRVQGGRVLCRLLVGQVTTVIQSQTTNVKVTSKALNAASAAIGTAVDISANVDGNAKEVGSMYIVLSSGAAAIWSNAGAGLTTLGEASIVLPQGEIYITTGASSTGAMQWDLWYQPLDNGAYVTPVAVATVAI